MTPEEAAQAIIGSWGVPKPDVEPSGTPLERTIRMLDEERTMRFRSEAALINSARTNDALNREIDFVVRERDRLSERNRELNHQLANTDTFKGRNDARLADGFLNHLHMEHRDFFDPTMDKIPMIKAVRETFGIGLKESKELVDVWHFDHNMAGMDAENAAEVIAHEDEGTFEEEVDLSGPEVDNPFLVDADR